MLTDYESIFADKAPWPPNDEDTRQRHLLYDRNSKLYKGRHNAIWEDEIRKLRGDKSGELRIILNFHMLLSGLWADMVCSEMPGIRCQDEAQSKILKRIIDQNLLWIKVNDGVVDYSKCGTNVIKIRYKDMGIIENVPPKYWYPIVSMCDVKTITAHVIAYTFIDANETKKNISYLKVEIHRPPLEAAAVNYAEDGIEIEYGPESSYVIEHRLYRLQDNKIKGGMLPLNTFREFAGLAVIEQTGLWDFDVFDIQNKPETDQLIGGDDYTNINALVKELELRYAQILRIEDKFADPSMYGPPIAERDPRDGEPRVVGGSKYKTVMEGMQPPGMLTWDGQLPANFTTVEHLMQRLYEVSKTCKVAFDASLAGAALSGTALKLMMARPISNASGIKLRYDANLKKAIRYCSLLEVAHGYPGAMEITDFSFDWRDGLPNDPMEESQIDSNLVSSKARSPEGIMRGHGMSEKQITQEIVEMAGKVI